jgi:hypothetical protein
MVVAALAQHHGIETRCMGVPAAVDALYHVAWWIPGYLDFDESRALAVGRPQGHKRFSRFGQLYFLGTAAATLLAQYMQTRCGPERQCEFRNDRFAPFSSRLMRPHANA